MPQRRAAPPVSDAEVLGCPDTYARGVPYDRLERLRTRTPVVWLDGRLSERPGAWAVLRYADVQYALAHPELFTPELDGILHGPVTHDDADGTADGEDPGRGHDPPAEAPAPALIDMDPPVNSMLDRMPDGEAVDFVKQVAGDVPETLRNTLAGGLYALLRHPGEYERLQDRRSDDRLLDSAVEEMLRWWTPVMRVWRTMRCGAVIGGVPLLAGERVVLWLASANHDEEVFRDPGQFVPERFLPEQFVPEQFVAEQFVPEQFVPERYRGGSGGSGGSDGPSGPGSGPGGGQSGGGPGREGKSGGRTFRPGPRHQRDQRVRPHLCFGYGDRACLGARLARVHLRALLVGLLERPGRIRPVGEPLMLRSSARHGFERLPVRWTP